MCRFNKPPAGVPEEEEGSHAAWPWVEPSPEDEEMQSASSEPASEISPSSHDAASRTEPALTVAGVALGRETVSGVASQTGDGSRARFPEGAMEGCAVLIDRAATGA